MYRLGVTPLPTGLEFDLIVDGQAQEHVVIGIRSMAEPKEMLLIKKGFEHINSILGRASDRVWVPVNSSIVRYHATRGCSIARQRRTYEIRVPVSRHEAENAGLEACEKCLVLPAPNDRP